MDYEKKYKEALERAREALNEIPLESYGARKIIIDAFPELAETKTRCGGGIAYISIFTISGEILRCM